MRVVFKLGPATDGKSEGAGPGFAVSLILHLALASVILLSPQRSDRAATLYDQLIAPNERKIIWYPLRQIPITPMKKIGSAASAQGRDQRKQLTISEDPQFQGEEQFVRTPEPKTAVENRIKTPNLVAIAVPEQEKVSRSARSFIPPTKSLTAPSAAPAVLEPPTVDPSHLRKDDGLGGILTMPAARPTRTFVPPSPRGSAREDRLGVESAPNGPDVIVLSTTPLDALMTPIPEGLRRAQVSGAPRIGALASGDLQQRGLKLSGIAASTATILNKNAPSASAPTSLVTSIRRTVYTETRLTTTKLGTSAPLRPSARIIPDLIESYFHNRVVYTILIAKPHLPVYASDWELWFAEKYPQLDTAPQIRAPHPITKIESAQQQAPLPLGRVKVSALILRTGEINSITVLKGSGKPQADAAAADDLQCWRFMPALRDGYPIDVEVIIDISFQPLSNSTGTSGH